MRVTSEVLQQMRPGRLYESFKDVVNSISFSDGGHFLIASADDETMQMYDIQDGQEKKTIFSKRYGCAHVTFTHSDSEVLFASKNAFDHALRYLSIHDNQYLRYFRGHRQRVLSLKMHPRDDSFVSSSLDNTIRLWDARTPTCEGLIRVTGQSLVSFDPTGAVLGVACAGPKAVNSGEGAIIKLYDVREMDGGPFTEFAIPTSQTRVSGFSFSPDGKQILVSTPEAKVHMLDAFNGAASQTFVGHTSSIETPKVATFSQDANFVLCGSDDNAIYVWESVTGALVTKWQGHTSPAAVVACAPKHMMVASGGKELAFWVPEMSAGA